MIKRYQAGRGPYEVPGPDPVHYRVKYLGTGQFAGFAVVGDQEIPLDPRVLRPTRLEAELDCILSGQRTMRTRGVRHFTVED